MKNGEILIGLVEQAASAVTMLSPADYAQADQLQAIVTQIHENMEVTEADPAQWRQKTKAAASSVSELLTQMIQEQTDDCQALIDAVTASVMQMQDYIGQVIDANGDVIPEVVEAPSSPTPAAEAVMISQDDAPLVLDFIAESTEHIESAESGLLELESRPDDSEVLNLIFRSFHTIKGMAGFLNLTEIGSLAHLTENLLDLARKGRLLLSGTNSDIVFESIDVMKKLIEGLKRAVETSSPVPSEKTLPALLERLQASGAAAENGQTPADRPAQAPAPQAVVAPAPDQQTDAASEPAPKEAPETVSAGPETPRDADHKGAVSDEKIKVSTARLDNLVNMTGELVISQLMVAEEAASGTLSQYELNRKIAHQGKIIRELQELSMSMRMVQISGVFQKMTRLVRDVSRKSQKQINFVTDGEETELDRSVVDKIADPLIHMLRNSVDHGIESPPQRTQAGKDPVGKIELRAFHQAGNIVIQIEDDGKGLDKERIFKKAVDNGIVDPDQPLTDEQIYRLIFHAGLSTAEKITSVSGRGVGMDVVKKNIEALRGRVDIASTPGRGTVFTIRLPLTLAMIDGQVVMVGNSRYIVPINAIIGTLRPKPDQISTVHNRVEMVLVRDELMPLVRLYNLFNVTPQTEDPTQALLVIVEDDDARKCCLLVDDLLAQQRVVIKSLGEGLGKVQCASGGAIMGDGKVSLILDIPSLISRSQLI